MGFVYRSQERSRLPQSETSFSTYRLKQADPHRVGKPMRTDRPHLNDSIGAWYKELQAIDLPGIEAL